MPWRFRITGIASLNWSAICCASLKLLGITRCTWMSPPLPPARPLAAHRAQDARLAPAAARLVGEDVVDLVAPPALEPAHVRAARGSGPRARPRARARRRRRSADPLPRRGRSRQACDARCRGAPWCGFSPVSGKLLRSVGPWSLRRSRCCASFREPAASRCRARRRARGRRWSCCTASRPPAATSYRARAGLMQARLPAGLLRRPRPRALLPRALLHLSRPRRRPRGRACATASSSAPC